MQNLAEWINEVPGRTVIITAATNGVDLEPHHGVVRLVVRDRVLGRKAACQIEVRESMFSEEGLGEVVVAEIKESVRRLIYSFVDRN